MADVAAELAAVRQMLEDHERRLYPIAPDELPAPTRRVTDTGELGMNGPRWHVGEWAVIALDDPDWRDCVYLDRDFPLAGDIEAIPIEDARRLAAALLAAVNYCEDDLAKRRAVTP